MKEYFREYGEDNGYFPPDTLMLLRAGRAGVDIVRGALGDGDEFTDSGVAEMRAVLDALPPSHPHRAHVRVELGTALITQVMSAAGADGFAEAVDHLDGGVDDLPSGHPRRPEMLLRAARGHLVIALSRQDRAAAEHGMRIADLGLAEEPDASGTRVRLAFFAAVARYVNGQITRDLRWFTEAASRLEVLLADDSTPLNPDIESGIRMMLAMTRREEGRREAAREAGLGALWAHGKAVLLQTGSGRALARARSVYPSAEQIIDWHVLDGDLEGAVAALELGRGLVLHAATSAADLPSLLEDLGYGELAAEWRAAPAAYGTWPWERHQELPGLLTEQGGLVAPTELGRRALAALVYSAAETRLLSPRPRRTSRGH